MSIWLSHQLKTYLRRIDSLIVDTKDLVQKIRHIPIKRCTVLIKCDVKDFYLSGDHFDLTLAVSNFLEFFKVDCDKKGIIMDCLEFLLDNQFVQKPSTPGKDGTPESAEDRYHRLCNCWQVLRGTGMGLPHSGEVADAAMFASNELLWTHNVAIREHHEITFYGRYRDDIIIIGDNIKKAHDFFDGLRKGSKFFELKLEEFSLVSVRFLQVTIEKNVQKGCIDIRPFRKKSNQGIPLEITSSHPFATHRGWPISLVRNLRSISSSVGIAKEAKDELVQHFLHNGASPLTVHLMKGTDLLAMNYNGKSTDNVPKVWFTVSFHPIWFEALRKAIGKINCDIQLSRILGELFGRVFQIRIAWKAGGQKICDRLVNL